MSMTCPNTFISIGSCSSPTPSNSVSSNNLPHLSRFNQSADLMSQRQQPQPSRDCELETQFASFNLNNLTPQVPELTPTNSKGKLKKV